MPTGKAEASDRKARRMRSNCTTLNPFEKSSMKRTATTFAILSLLAISGSAFAADEKKGDAKPAASQNAGGKVSAEDQEFVTTAAQGGIAEVKSGELAKEKGTSPEVKELAAMMIGDHGKANEDLKKIATGKGLQVPEDTDAKHKAAMDKLGKLSGAEFDKAYIAQMEKDHKKTISDFEKASKSVKDPELKGFAEKTLPTLRGHLEHVKKVQASQGKGGEKKASS
jgi:putative membrane protein